MTRRLLALLLTLVPALAAGGASVSVPGGPGTSASPIGAGAATAVRVVLDTTEGPLTVELYPALAPRTVARFLARAGLAAPPDGVAAVFPYAGSQVCELRARALVTFGCAATGPPAPEQPRPKAPGIEPPLPDEIDGVALGLDRQTIAEPHDADWLLQQEVVPRVNALRDRGRPIPPGLAALLDEAAAKGVDAARRSLTGRTRLWYLQTAGYVFTPGASALRTARGVLFNTNAWPGEADERFRIAFDALPDRDGRATAFGRVVDGFETLDRIERQDVDRYRRPRTPILIRGAQFAAAPAPASAPAPVSAPEGDHAR